MIANVHPTGVERFFGQEDIIVSKTDLKGLITYANDVFLHVAGYSEEEVLGKPHNMIRHPDMPRCVFKLLWDTISVGNEIFAYVKNMASNGDHYWVFAHVTPTFDASGRITNYHSNRRVPERSAVAQCESLYRVLKEEESKGSIEAATKILMNKLEQAGVSYGEFVFSL